MSTPVTIRKFKVQLKVWIDREANLKVGAIYITLEMKKNLKIGVGWKCLDNLKNVTEHHLLLGQKLIKPVNCHSYSNIFCYLSNTIASC